MYNVWVYFQAWTRQTQSIQLPSRLLPRLVATPPTQASDGQLSVKDAHFYNCPLDTCDTVVKSGELVPHLQTHDGPVVQYLCKDSSTYLRFPVSQLTTISLPGGTTFVLHATPHPAAPECLLLWLWLGADSSTAASYTFQLDLPNNTVASGHVFPLSWTTQRVLDFEADKCIVLNDFNFDTSCTKVKITIQSKCDTTAL